MSDDSLARTPPAPSSVDADYEAIHATIVATERGRWFLDQYAHRHRGADIERVLAAVERIEQAIRAGCAAEVADTASGEFAAMRAKITQTRTDVIGRYGDPAVSSEAAVTDFRNAAEQIQHLISAAHGRDSELGAQLSFQINRLASAGERLEHGLGALRILLGLLEGFDRRLRRLVADAERPLADVPPRPAAPLSSSGSPIEWRWPVTSAGEKPSLGSEPPLVDTTLVGADLDAPPAQRSGRHTEMLWDQDGDHTELSADTRKASVADCAVAPAEAGVAPAAEGGHDPPAEQPDPPLQRLEAREYGQRHVPTAGAPAASGLSEASLPHADAPEEPHVGVLDGLGIDAASASGEDGDAPAPASELPGAEWAFEPTIPAPESPGAIADSAAAESQAPIEGAGADMPSVLQRLERMRTAIAALRAELNEKTARRNPSSGS